MPAAEQTCYVLVRRPIWNMEQIEGSRRPAEPPSCNGVYYGGIGRMPWWDIGGLFYAQRLSPECSNIYKKINGIISRVEYTHSAEEVLLLWSALGELTLANEIVAFAEVGVGAGVERTPKWPLLQGRLLGFDLAGRSSYASALLAIMDWPPHHAAAVDLLNAQGLLRDTDAADEFRTRVERNWDEYEEALGEYGIGWRASEPDPLTILAVWSCAPLLG